VAEHRLKMAKKKRVALIAHDNRKADLLEWARYNKRDLCLNKEQLLALGDRNFPEREKKLELQHHTVATFNIGHKNLPPKTS